MFTEIKTVSNEVKSKIDLASRGYTDLIVSEIQSGISQLWRLKAPYSGYLVTRLENTELVLVIGVGRGLRPAVKFLCEFCINNDIRSIRTHVVNKGLVRIYESLGFFVYKFENDEYILKKEF